MGCGLLHVQHIFFSAAEMIFHAPHLLLAFRWLIPAIGIFGNSTNHCVLVAMLRLLLFPCSVGTAARWHAKLASKYMGLIAFFYENWSGVKVSYCLMACHDPV